MGVSQQRVSAIESGGVAELATLADYIRALGGELKVIADFGDSWRRVA
jgi:vacuolar-type H+-ATPase catalytic subunit A/Vma1